MLRPRSAARVQRANRGDEQPPSQQALNNHPPQQNSGAQPRAFPPQLPPPPPQDPNPPIFLAQYMFTYADRGEGFFRQFTAPGIGLEEDVTCLICEEKHPRKDLFRSLCNHWHCLKCLKENALIALKSNPFTPARCCLVIPKESLGYVGALTEDELKQYSVKMEELTNPRRKLYCWGEDCGAFIPLDSRKRRVGECASCGRKTCKTCHAKSHFGACDQSKLKEAKEGVDEVYRLAESKGWKRCPNCLNMVQKDGGCNHMTCSCGQAFCYRCGQVFGGYSHNCEQNPAGQNAMDENATGRGLQAR